MMLLTKENEKALPALCAQEGKGDEAIAYVKFFTPDAAWTWYATEYSPEEGLFFGLVVGQETELGYFTLAELKSYHGRACLAMERDRYFRPTTLGEIKANPSRY